VRRLAIFGGRLYLGRDSGQSFQWPLKHVRVTDHAVAGGWYSVGLGSGSGSMTFFVPPLIAATVASAAD
jgi:hypothetical protein